MAHAKTVHPNVGALLPFNRIVTYYGNFYSKSMSALGECPPTSWHRDRRGRRASIDRECPTTR
ncbi:MAG: hypothetical protein WC763_00220 [Candidatus Paceibacterota bacterium]|jgi:hypothetical protein